MFSLRFLAPAAFAALALCGSTTHAATFNVNSNGDSQALIDAINAANSNGEADTINISSRVNFTEADNTTYGPTGFPVIKNDGELTINAVGNAFIGRINNVFNPKVRIFAVGPGARFTINGLRFFNGSAGTGSGGSGSAVANRGGAIYNGNGGTVTLNNCDFDYNTAVSGSCVFNGAGATLKVNGGVYGNNIADIDGGAIFNEAGTATVENASFNANQAAGTSSTTGYGGVLCNSGAGILRVGGCALGDAGRNTARSGGAIATLAGATTSIENSSLRFNSANFGGAVFNEGATSLANCLVDSNQVSVEGGGIHTRNLSGGVGPTQPTLQIRNSTLTANYANNPGSAVRNLGGYAIIENCTLTQNIPAANGTLQGALANNTSAFTRTRVSDTIIAGNDGGDVNYSALNPDRENIESGGYNLIGFGNAASSFKGPGDQTGVRDPRLNPLANNGGPTLTAAPQPDSLAVNAGNPALTGENQFDQRGPGFPRVRGGRIDIGAYETQNGAPRVSVTLAPNAPKTNDVLTATAVVTSETGSPTVIYQWLRNGEPIPNETETTLQLARAGNGDKNDEITVIVRAMDSQGTSAPASAQVTVVNSVPIAVSSQGNVDVDTEKGFPLLGFDADGDKLDYIRVGGPRNGVLADIRLGDDGVTRLFYRSRPKYGGVDIIRFVVRDDDGKISNESTLGISVSYTPPPPVNRKPIAGDTNIDTFVDTSVIKGLLGSDPDGDPITFRIVNNAKFGFSEIKRDTDGLFKLFYTSLPKFYGPDRVTYIAIDRHGAQSNIATVNINFTNRKPVAQGNQLTVASGEPVSQFLFGTDEDRDELSFRLINNPQHGRGEVKRDEFGNWRVYYQSSVGYVGPDQITFIAIDPMGRESFAAAADINVVRVAGTPSVPNAVRSGAAPSGGGS